MTTQKYTLSIDVKVGIWDNCEYVARVYADKIIVVSPYINWSNNSGSLAIKKEAIRNPATVAAVLADLSDDCKDSAWGKIGRAINDDYLAMTSEVY